MPRYFCKLGRPDGRIEEQVIEAIDADSLRMSLEDKGFLVLSFREKGGLPLHLDELLLKKGVSSKEFLVYNQEFITLVRAGMPIVNALDVVSRRVANKHFKAVLDEMKKEIRAGLALSDAASRHPSIFPDLYVATVRSGEKSGDLVVVLGRYVRYLKRLIALRRKVLSAMTYPVFLLLILGALLAFLLLYLVPTFSGIYADFKGDLPLATKILITTTQAGKAFALPIILALISLVVAAVLWYRTDKGRLFFDSAKLRVPFLGSVLELYAVSQFTRTLGSLLGGGVPPVGALDMASASIPNRALSAKLIEAVSRVREGGSISAALEKTGVVPEMTVRMIEVGESSGALEDMLGEISDFYEDEIETKLSTLTSLIEPVLLLFMGIVIGGIVVVMYLPIFNLAGTVR
ncbi:MAG: type II secretion system F family protein [Nitrospirota bacterium]|nr:type II secretion system F family protein [Nitrospirota bacterium]